MQRHRAGHLPAGQHRGRLAHLPERAARQPHHLKAARRALQLHRHHTGGHRLRAANQTQTPLVTVADAARRRRHRHLHPLGQRIDKHIVAHQTRPRQLRVPVAPTRRLVRRRGHGHRRGRRHRLGTLPQHRAAQTHHHQRQHTRHPKRHQHRMRGHHPVPTLTPTIAAQKITAEQRHLAVALRRIIRTRLQHQRVQTPRHATTRQYIRLPAALCPIHPQQIAYQTAHRKQILHPAIDGLLTPMPYQLVRNVVRRARQTHLRGVLHQANVTQRRTAIQKQHIPRLDVAMHQIMTVQRLDARQHLLDDRLQLPAVHHPVALQTQRQRVRLIPLRPPRIIRQLHQIPEMAPRLQTAPLTRRRLVGASALTAAPLGRIPAIGVDDRQAVLAVHAMADLAHTADLTVHLLGVPRQIHHLQRPTPAAVVHHQPDLTIRAAAAQLHQSHLQLTGYGTHDARDARDARLHHRRLFLMLRPFHETQPSPLNPVRMAWSSACSRRSSCTRIRSKYPRRARSASRRARHDSHDSTCP